MQKWKSMTRVLLMGIVLSVVMTAGCSADKTSGTSSVVSSPAESVSVSQNEQSVAESSEPETQVDFEYQRDYHYDDDGKEVYHIRLTKYIGSSTKVTIPEKIDSYPVETLDSRLFSDTSVEEITIPDTVTEMNYSCFENCQKLTSVTLPAKIKSIPTSAFKNCKALTSIEIPEGVVTIESQAFMDCDNLSHVTIPESVREIESGTFMNCVNLGEIAFPSNMEAFGSDVLYNTKLFNDAPEGDIYIGNVYYAYKFDTSTTEAAIKSVQELTQKGKITFAEGTRIIASLAFCNTEGKKELPPVDVEIPDSVVYAGSGAFYWLNIGTINLNASVARLSNDAMMNGCNVREVKWGENVTEIAENLFNAVTIEHLEIPATVKKINDTAFFQSGVKSVLIHEGTEYIGSRAFMSCSELEKVFIPASVKTFGEGYANVFEESPKVVIYTIAGSAAEKYAKEHNIPVETIEGEGAFTL